MLARPYSSSARGIARTTRSAKGCDVVERKDSLPALTVGVYPTIAPILSAAESFRRHAAIFPQARVTGWKKERNHAGVGQASSSNVDVRHVWRFFCLSRTSFRHLACFTERRVCGGYPGSTMGADRAFAGA